MRTSEKALFPSLFLALPMLAQGQQCQIEDVAGTYSSQWGSVQCAVNDEQLECCYGNLTICDKKLYLTLADDATELRGRWEYSTGTTGSAKFAVDDKCDLQSGFWGSGPVPTGAWTVSRRLDEQEPETNEVSAKAQRAHAPSTTAATDITESPATASAEDPEPRRLDSARREATEALTATARSRQRSDSPVEPEIADFISRFYSLLLSTPQNDSAQRSEMEELMDFPLMVATAVKPWHQQPEETQARLLELYIDHWTSDLSQVRQILRSNGNTLRIHSVTRGSRINRPELTDDLCRHWKTSILEEQLAVLIAKRAVLLDRQDALERRHKLLELTGSSTDTVETEIAGLDKALEEQERQERVLEAELAADCVFANVVASYAEPASENSIVYTLAQKRSGWALVDLQVNQISAVLTHRSNYRAASVDWSDIEGLLARLQDQFGAQEAQSRRTRKATASRTESGVTNASTNATHLTAENGAGYAVETMGSANAPHLFTVHYSVGCHHCLIQLEEAIPVIRRGIKSGLVRVQLLESSDAVGFSKFTSGVANAADAMYCIRHRRPDINSIDLIDSLIRIARSSVAEDASVGWYQWFYAKPEELIGVASVEDIGGSLLEEYGLDPDTVCSDASVEREKQEVERRFDEKGYNSVPTAEFDDDERDDRIGVFLSRKLAEAEQASN